MVYRCSLIFLQDTMKVKYPLKFYLLNMIFFVDICSFASLWWRNVPLQFNQKKPFWDKSSSSLMDLNFSFPWTFSSLRYLNLWGDYHRHVQLVCFYFVSIQCDGGLLKRCQVFKFYFMTLWREVIRSRLIWFHRPL